MFLLVPLSKSKFFTRVALVSLVSGTRVARVWHSCCKLDEIYKNTANLIIHDHHLIKYLRVI